MNQYIGFKVINAKSMTRAEYNAFRGWSLPADENGDDEGYLVEYIDGGKANTSEYAGYVSWSPKDVFERAYHSTDCMVFGEAMMFANAGKCVTRADWNDKGVWVGLHCEGGVFVREACGTELQYSNYLILKTKDNCLVPWVPSQADMQAKDWMVVE